MSEQETQEVVDETQVSQEASEEVQPEEAQTEVVDGNGQEPETETIVEDMVDSELLEEAVPELSNYFHDMKPQAREEYLLKKLIAERADGAPDQGQESQVGVTAESNAQSTQDIPTIDREAMKARIIKAHNEGDGEAVADVLGEFFAYTDGILKTVDGALQQSSQRQQNFQQEIDKFRQPALLKEALNEVSIATEADIPAAIEYLSSGDVTNHKAALALAANDRQYRTQKATRPTRTPSEAATRAAAARAASDAGSQTRYPARAQGTATPIIQFNAESLEGVADEILPKSMQGAKRRGG